MYCNVYVLNNVLFNALLFICESYITINSNVTIIQRDIRNIDIITLTIKLT